MSVNQEQYELLESYVSGNLDAAGQAQIQALLAQNPQLQQMLKDLTAQREMLRRLPRASSPEDLLESFQGQLEREALLGGSTLQPEPRIHVERWPRFVLAAAIFFLVMGLAALIYEVLPEHRDTIPLVDSQGVSTDLDRSATTTSTSPVLGDLAPPPVAPGGVNTGISDSNFGNSPSAVPTTQLLNGSVAKALGGGRGLGLATDENLRQLKQIVEQNTTTSPSDIPVVIVVRSENPSRADAQVAQFLESNGIVFESTSARQSPQEQAAIATPPATTLPGALGGPQHALAQRVPSSNARFAARAPVTLPSSNFAAAAPKEEERHPQALALQSGPEVAQEQPPAQVTYRALLTDQQVELLNAQLLDRPNQWTEVHGQIATDALPANAMRNAVVIAQNRAPTTSNSSIVEQSFDREKLGPSTQPGQDFAAKGALSEAATQPAPTTRDISSVAPASQPTALRDVLSFKTGLASTQPITITVAATGPSQMRTCLIIVNTQPVAFPAASEPAATQTAATEPATQP